MLRRSVGSRVRARSDVGLERDATSPRLAYTLLTVVVTALHVNYVTYDPKFNDTNVKRLLAAMQDDEHVDKRSPKFKVGDSGGAGGDGPPPRCNLLVYIYRGSNDTDTVQFLPCFSFPTQPPIGDKPCAAEHQHIDEEAHRVRVASDAHWAARVAQ